MSREGKPPQELWQDCLFLSKELHKFATVEDTSLFEDLLRQREELLSIIKETPAAGEYARGAEGQAIVREIVDLDKVLHSKFIRTRNLLKQSLEVSAAYDGIIGDSVGLGTRFDSNGQ
jgi:hypothetical protein